MGGTRISNMGGGSTSSSPTTFSRSATKIVAASNSLDTTNADYICTGTNDHLKINTALAALTNGGRVILLEGTYNLGGAITILKSNTTLEGQGAGTLLKLANSINTNCIEVGEGTNTYSDITIKNIQIDGNMANQTSGGHGITILAHTSITTVEGCHVKNTYGANININAATAAYCKILDNYLDTVKTGTGWANIEGGGNNILIRGNTCISGDFDGINVYNGSKPVVVNNIVITPTLSGIDNSCLEAIIEGNFINNPTTRGIESANVANIVGNYILITNNPTQPCIDVSLSDPQTITGNHILVLSGNTAAVTGIQMATNAVTITGNTIQFETNQAHIGILGNGGRQYITVSGNTLQDYNEHTGGKGIDFSSGLIDSSIFGNSIIGFETGCDLTGVSLSDVSGNHITAKVGLLITNCLDTTIVANNIEGLSGTNGIQAVNTARQDRLVINDNSITNFTNCITLQGVGFSSINGNNISKNGVSVTNGILITSTGVAYSTYNVINGNVLSGTMTNGIKENSVNDGPNIITSNISKGPTNPIVTASGSTISANNITV